MTTLPRECPARHIAGGGHVVLPRWFRRTLLITGILYWGLIFVLTHLPPQDLPAVGVGDKLAHFLAYGLLGGLLFLTVWAMRPRTRWIGVIVFIFGVLYGALDEISQPAVGRTCELFDWLTDAAALLIAATALSAVKSIVEHRLRYR